MAGKELPARNSVGGGGGGNKLNIRHLWRYFIYIVTSEKYSCYAIFNSHVAKITILFDVYLQ